MNRLVFGLAMLLAGLLVSPVLAQPTPGTDTPASPVSDVLVRLDGDLDVGVSDIVPPALVLDGDVTVDGLVRDGLLVVDGLVTVRGTVDGPVVVVDGALVLEPSARIQDDVVLVESDLTRSPDAFVGGEVTRTSAFHPAVSAFFWLSGTVAVLVLGMVFVFLLGGRPSPVVTALEQPGPAALAGLALLVGLPLLAVGFFATGIGLAVGFSVLLTVIPALALLGYVVSGVALGRLIFLRFGRPENPYGATAAGLGLLQVFLAVPLLGLISLLAAPYGAGALLVALWQRRLQRDEAPVPEHAEPYAVA